MKLAMRRAGGWMEVAADVEQGSRGQDPWTALAWNAASHGLARFVVRPGDPRLSVRADVWLGDGAPRAAEMDDACDDVRRLIGMADPPLRLPEVNSKEPRHGVWPLGASSIDLAALLSEISWPCAPRASGRYGVDLGISNRYQHATAWIGPTGRPCLRARLAVLSGPTAVTRTAVGVLLLTLGACVRLVRSGVEEAGDGEATLFVDATLSRTPSAVELDRAIAAAALACRMASYEARVLMDPRLAGDYLVARGWADSPVTTTAEGECHA